MVARALVLEILLRIMADTFLRLRCLRQSYLLVQYVGIMLRQIITKAFLPHFDRELGRSIGKEVSTMGKDLCPLQSASAFSFRPASGAGAFGRTAAAQAPARAVRVEKPVTSNGLFHC